MPFSPSGAGASMRGGLSVHGCLCHYKWNLQNFMQTVPQYLAKTTAVSLPLLRCFTIFAFMRCLLFILPLFLLGSFVPAHQSVPAWRLKGTAQGTTWQLTYYAPDSLVTTRQVDSLLQSLDSSLSIYKPWSLISSFNASATGIAVDHHLIQVINASLETYRQSNGIFDVTVQPLVQAWGFSAKKMNTLPDSGTIQTLKQCVDSRYLSLRGNQLLKSKPCVRIDVDGIAQGYSVDVITAFLEANKINTYLVELGGEIRVKGRKQPSGEKLKIGIESPGNDEFSMGLMKKFIRLDSGAITTSGNYRRYYESNGKKISHIIDPRTGYSAQNELISVTVFARDAMTADAYDNVLMVLGLEKALRFLETRRDLGAYFIYRTKDGHIADTANTLFNTFMQ